MLFCFPLWEDVCFLLATPACRCNADGPPVVQAEYIDPSTLEARLQSVARRMVSTTPRRPDSERGTPTPPPQQNGYGGPGLAVGSYASAATGVQFPNAGGLQAFPGPSGTIAPQDQLLASSSAGLQSSMPQAMGMQQGQPRQYAQHMSMPGQQQGGPGASRMGPAQDSQAMGLLGSTQIKPEGGSNPMGMAAGGNYTMNGPSHAGFMQQQQATGTGPVMSNGAPVLLRSSRDWAPGQSPTVLSVSPDSSPGLYFMAKDQSCPKPAIAISVHMPLKKELTSLSSPAQTNTMPSMQTGNSRITINGETRLLAAPFTLQQRSVFYLTMQRVIYTAS